MQGRLVAPVGGVFQSFPVGHWEEEIALAAQVPLDGIEWIYDLRGEGHNPLESDAGIRQLRALADVRGIAVRSLCADYFMDRPVLRTDETTRRDLFARLCWLLERSALIGVTRIVLPFVDASRIAAPEEEETVLAFIRQALPLAETHGTELHVESSLEPEKLAALMNRLPHRLVKVNYDSGNSASLGYHPHDEFHAYGSRIGSVHIKDRVRGGGTVPLGTGAVDFAALRQCLRKANFDRGFVLQVARGEPGKEVSWTQKNKQFVLDWWKSTGSAS